MQQPGPTSHTTASQAQPAALSGYSMNFNMFPPAPGLVPPGMLLHQHQQAHHQAFLCSQPHPQHYHHLIHQNTNNMYLPGGPAPSLPVNAAPRASATPPVDPFLASGQGQHHTGWSAVPTAYHAAYGLPTATSYYSHHHQYGPQPPFAMVPHFYGAQWGAGPPPGGYTVTYVHHIGVPPPNSQDPAGLPPPPVQATPAPPVSATAFAEPRRPEQDTSDSNVQTNSNEASKGTKSNSKSERNSGDSKSQPSSNSELTYADVLRSAVSEDAAVLEELVDAGRVSAIADLLLKKYSVTYRHLEVTAFALSHPEHMERQRKLWEGKQIPIPDGIYTAYYLWHRSHTAGTRRELCMKHNGRAKNGEPYDRCLYGDARCKFRHECAFCRLPDHGWFAVGRCSARLRLQDELAALGLVNYSDTPTSVTPEEQADSDETAGAERRRSAVSPAATGSKTTTSGRSRLSSGSPADGNGSSGSKVRHNFVKVEADTAVAVPVQKPKAARPQAAEKEGDDSGDGSSVNGRGLAVRWYTAGLTQQDNAKVERAARLLFGSGPRGPAAAATSSGGSASVASATASVAAAGGAATLGTELRHRTATQHRGALAAAGASASTTPSQPMTGSSSDPPTASERNDDKDTPPSSASGNCAADGSRDAATNGTAPSDSTGGSSRSHSDSTSSPAAQASP